MEAAGLIKSKNPHSIVEVKDLKSGDVTAVALGPGEPIYLALFYGARLDLRVYGPARHLWITPNTARDR